MKGEGSATELSSQPCRIILRPYRVQYIVAHYLGPEGAFYQAALLLLSSFSPMAHYYYSYGWELSVAH